MSTYKFETLQLHVGQENPDPATDSRAVPIYQTTSYVFHNSKHAADRFGLADAGNIYGRLTNSTQDVFEKRIAALEGGVAALAVASGAAAIDYTIKALAQAGDHIVAQKTIYGGSYNLLAHTLKAFGIETTFVDNGELPYTEDVKPEMTPETELPAEDSFVMDTNFAEEPAFADDSLPSFEEPVFTEEPAVEEEHAFTEEPVAFDEPAFTEEAVTSVPSLYVYNGCFIPGYLQSDFFLTFLPKWVGTRPSSIFYFISHT